MRKNPSKKCSLAMKAQLPAMVSAISLALVSVTGCSLHKAQRAFQEGRYDDAVREYREIMKKAPENRKADLGYRRAAQKASEAHLTKSMEAKKRGLTDIEKKELEEAIRFDPTNSVAIDRLMELEEELRARKEAEEKAGSISEMMELGENKAPVLINPRSIEGVDLNFQRKTSLKEIFANLSRASGINILMHSTLQDSPVSVDLRGLQFQQILDTLMIQNELIYMVIDPKTILVSKDTSSNRSKYENHSIQVFHLSYANPQDVQQTLTSLVTGSTNSGSFRVYADKRQNALTVRGKPRILQAAARIVKQMDKARPEVMIYLELLEVTETVLEKIGIKPYCPGLGDSPYMAGVTLDDLGKSNSSTGGININRENLRFIYPSIAIDALKQNGDATMKASPNIRVTSDTEGTVTIGQNMQVLSSTVNLPGNLADTAKNLGVAIPSEQYTPQDVGVNIKVKPRVHHNADISLEIDSTITTIPAGTNASRPTIGKRVIKTQARLRDGETVVFAGMFKEKDNVANAGVWGLADVPFIGKLFNSKRNEKDKVDVLLTVRAVIVRKPELKKADFESFDPDFAKNQTGPFSADQKSPRTPPDHATPPPADTPMHVPEPQPFQEPPPSPPPTIPPTMPTLEPEPEGEPNPE